MFIKSNSLWMLIILFGLYLLIGCASVELTDAGTNVNVLVKEEPTKNCKYIDDVEKATTQMSPVLLSMTDLKKYFRNQAAEKGGNLVVIDTVLIWGKGQYFGSGRVFKCK